MEHLQLAQTKGGIRLHLAVDPKNPFGDWEDVTLCGAKCWNRPAVKWPGYMKLCFGCLSVLESGGKRFGC